MKNLFLLFVILNLFQDNSVAQQLKTNNKPRKTIDSLLTVLKISKEDTNKIRTLNKLSQEHIKFSEYDLGIQYSTESIKTAGEIENKTNNPEVKKAVKKGMAISFNNIGLNHYLKGNYDQALEFYFKSLKIREEFSDKPGIGNSYNNIGRIYYEQSKYSEALKNYVTALKLFKELNDKSGIASTYNRIGSVYKKQAVLLRKENGNSDSIHRKSTLALENYFASLKMREEIGNKSGIAAAYNNIGIIYFQQGDYDKALDNYFVALKIFEETREQYGIAASYGNIGNIYVKQNQFPNANNYLQKALALSKQIEAKDLVMETYEALCETYEKTNDYKNAYYHHKLYSGIKDSIFNEQSNKHMSEMQTRYETEKKEAQIKLLNKDKEIQNKEVRRQNTQRNAFIAGFGLMFALAGVSYRSYRNSRKANTIISSQKHLVEEKQKEILDSINYALRIQSAILAPEKNIKEIFPDSLLLYKPKDIVAGDFYFFETTPTHVFYAAADCTGHGVPGALVSVVCSNALTRCVKEFGLTEPGQILDKARELVIDTFAKSESEVKDGMDISLCVIENHTCKISWAGANNPLWYFSNGELNEIKADKQPIGKHENPKPFTTNKLQLNRNDIIYLFTDGYADQFGGEKGKKFKYAKLKDTLFSIKDMQMDQQKEILNTTFENWKGNLEQVDDVCIIGIRIQ